ncbi:DNA translocase FtsK [Insolitispirillum peregrinum]|uniref:DNA translocase FtsK n=1 Tax=Insolitispirillum peregrinum TaxID=80876 RepID=A0A1N7JGF0_9PROT|nr:DNA translocase FtsK [Insolitispirillum peregrinum]SIS48334.1 DNA segregation ATPase FtsK/SpoIIIE, S-DNA-T family [Insolitispirillum peregrinum]
MALFGGKKTGLSRFLANGQQRRAGPRREDERREPSFGGTPSQASPQGRPGDGGAASALPADLQGWAVEPSPPADVWASQGIAPPAEPEAPPVPEARWEAPPELAPPEPVLPEPVTPFIPPVALETVRGPLWSGPPNVLPEPVETEEPPPAPSPPASAPAGFIDPLYAEPSPVPQSVSLPEPPPAAAPPPPFPAEAQGGQSLPPPLSPPASFASPPALPLVDPARVEDPSPVSVPSRAPSGPRARPDPRPDLRPGSRQGNPVGADGARRAPPPGRRPQGKNRKRPPAGFNRPRAKAAPKRPPLFPREVRESLQRTFWRLWGLAVVIFAGMVATALLTYAPTDPSLNTATHQAVLNALGVPGAYAADVLIQAFGLAGFAPILLLVAWGLRQAAALPITWLPLRLLSLLISLVLLATAFAPVVMVGVGAEVLPLPAGAGGFVGTLALASLRTAAAQAGAGRDVTWLVAWLSGVLALPFLAGAMELRWREARKGVHNLADLGRAAGSGAQRIRDAANEVAHASLEKVIGQRPLIPGYPAGRTEERADVLEPILVSATGEEISPAEAAWREQKAAAAAAAAALVEEPEDEPTIIARAIITPSRRARKRAEEQAIALRPDEDDGFRLPSLELLRLPLESSIPPVKEQTLERNARRLESVLAEFGVNGQIVEVRPGPVVTHYELCPTQGTKAARVVGLADDVARLMEVSVIRVAVMPGNATIGIEIPNGRRERINFRELLAEDDFRAHDHGLTLALGRDINGAPVFADLARMPHLLLAGGVGMGKTMAMNTMICSLLYRQTPDQCRLILIDPKGSSFNIYTDIPHLLTPVIRDTGQAIVALKWMLKEVENRNRVMSSLGVRTIASYNARLRDALEKGQTLTRTVQVGFDAETNQPKYEEQALDMTPLPLVVVVVDEMAPLMKIASKAMENLITHLMQVARISGVHLIMSTSETSTEVITPSVANNFPARIAFQVETKIDSRTILNEAGAENLLGPGDMLYLAQGGRMMRVHAPYVSQGEIETVVAHLQAEGEPNYVSAVLDDSRAKAVIDATAKGHDRSKPEYKGDEELFRQAVLLVARERKASTSFVQRKLQIPYNQAAEMIARMEQKGMISKASYIGQREVLLPTPETPPAEAATDKPASAE